MRGVVHRYPDVAEFYYKFVGEGWDRPVGRVDVEVRFPELGNASEVRAWAHGPPHGVVSVLADGVVLLSISPLPARTFWEARIAYPPDPFGGLRLESDGPRLSAILKEETAWADEANRLREEWRRRNEAAAEERDRRARRAEGLLPLSIALGLGALGTWFWLFTRHGRSHGVFARAAPGDVPSDHPPAAVSYLMKRTISGAAVAATLIDMANRGYLDIHESVVETRGVFGKKKRRMDYRFDVVAKPLSELHAFERDLLRFVLSEAGDDSGFSILALQKAALKDRTTFRRFFHKWNKDVTSYARSLRFYEPYPVRPMVFNAVCGAAILAVGVVLSVWSLAYVGVAAVAGGFLQAVLTAGLTRRTPEGQRLMLAWKAFRSHLRSVGRGLGPASLESSAWGRYVVAAVLFGVHERLLRNLKLDEGSGGAVYPLWFHASEGSGTDGGISGLASGVSTMVSTVSSAASSASGAGGGASAGGGGGSGGGGGGAG
jgi:uncharacterized membrane protein